MKRSNVKISRATGIDVDSWYRGKSMPSIKAFKLANDEMIYGLGGIMNVGNRWWAFLDLAEEAQDYKLLVARGAKRFFNELKKDGVKIVYSYPDYSEPTMHRLSTFCGFEPYGKYYIWRA